MDFFKSKKIGIVILDGTMTAISLDKGIYFLKDISDLVSVPYWEHAVELGGVIEKAVDRAGFSLPRPKVVFLVPPNISDEGKRAVLDSVMRSGEVEFTLLIEDIIAAAVGIDLINDPEDLTKNLYLYAQRDVSFLGLIFAGGLSQIRIVPKGYDKLTEADVTFELGALLDELPKGLPQKFYTNKLFQDTLQHLESAWQVEIPKKLNVTAPESKRGCWGNEIGGYRLIYSDEYELAAVKGVEKILRKVQSIKRGLYKKRKLDLRKVSDDPSINKDV